MTKTSYQFKDGVLPILISARIRLNDEERASLKQAYQKARAGYAPAKQPSVNGSSISVETNFVAQDLDKALGMDHYIFSDIINGRESIAISLILKIQKVLQVDIVNEERLKQACDGYISYLFRSEEGDA